MTKLVIMLLVILRDSAPGGHCFLTVNRVTVSAEYRHRTGFNVVTSTDSAGM